MLPKSYNEFSDSEQHAEEAYLSSLMPLPEKSKGNAVWTPAEEQRLKVMRDGGNSWGEIAKTFPDWTEESVKKHWYKDMHSDFADDDSAALLAAIKEYEASKWKVIGQKVGKSAKACEQYAKENFGRKEIEHPLEEKSRYLPKSRETDFKEPFVAPAALEHPDSSFESRESKSVESVTSKVANFASEDPTSGSGRRVHIRTPSDIMAERRDRESRQQRNVRTLNITEDIKAKREDLKPRSIVPGEVEVDLGSGNKVSHNDPDQLRTPQLHSHRLPQDVSSAPTQKSPPKPTPTKKGIKALPTVRDHTTDQLSPDMDEYIPREYDPAGEAKVNAQGFPQGGRQFKIRTFYVAHRRERRFMLAAECAHVLNYRDSYHLFSKNRSLLKIIASRMEMDELIQQGILPHSYKLPQIAIVTAKSIFRQFDARVIENGRRVRDDYWEAKAIKQGFTEQDMAEDKRPGAGKAMEAASAPEKNNPVDTGGPGQHQKIICADPTMESLNQDHFPSNDNMSLVKNQVLFVLSKSKGVRASLNMDWDLLGFMRSQYPDIKNANLDSVITLSGTSLHAQATTCSEYARQNWPSQGLKVVTAFQSAMDSPESKAQVSINDLDVHIELGERVYVEVELHRSYNSTINPYGSYNFTIIAEIFQQVIWMGSAIRVSKDQRVQYSTFELRLAMAKGRWWDDLTSNFTVTYGTSELTKDEQSCWLPVFTNPVIARGFPVPKRENGEQGLEIPLEIMAALGGARYVTEFEGGLVLKGYSAIFVPIKRHKQSIQWHLIRHSDEERILYRQLRNESLNRAMLEEVDHESLRTTRAFLGWWKSSETHLGTGDAAYDRVDWSPASEAKRPTRFSGANIGFQTMITGQLSFIVGAKDGRLHFSQKGPFQRIVQCAEKTPVVLYDLKDHRAWLVPALDVMLHVVQTRHRLSPYRIDGGDIELTPVNPENGRGAATEAVAANQLRQLYERDVAAEKGYYFKDAMLDIWSQMERLMEKDDSIEAYPGLALHGTMRSKIHGWEYMSLVHEKNYRRKEANIAKSSGGWVDLVNDVDALVLFATGFDEIIRPVTDLGKLCAPWRSLPKGKDYLAAGIPILELLYSEAGSRLSHKHLTTSHLQWQRGSTLFEQCSYAASDRCKCDRTQQIYHASLFKTFGRVRPPGDLEENGCAVFGQARHPFRPLKNVVTRQNAVHTLPNNPIRAAAVTKKVTSRDDYMISPSPPTSISSESGEFDDFGSRNPKRPPSPLSDHLVQEEAIPPKGRRDMSHLQKQNLDTFADPNNINDQISLPDDCAICPMDYQLMFKHNLRSKEECLVSAQITSPSEAKSAPVHALKTVHRNGKIGVYSHKDGCACATCPLEDSKPPGTIDFVETTTDAPGNTTKLVERRETEAV